jgi:membrane-bound serine protease (ClpP class)
MIRKWLYIVLVSVAFFGVKLMRGSVNTEQPKQVVVIPIHEEIGKPTLFILRRGLKEAIEHKADLVVLDLKTPGGEIDVTLEMIEALEKYPGPTIAYVNDEAMSAGAFISAVTQEIWFSPKGVIGAAAPVTSTGQDVDATMKQKLVSFLKARMRSISEGKGYRGQVVSAMIDSESELKISDQVIKNKGELLSLTASEAVKMYGNPSASLLGAGIANDLNALLEKKLGTTQYKVSRLEITWSEHLAVLLTRIAPILLGLGLLGLFIEFKVGGFGVFGIVGAGLLALVFLGGFVAGLSGHEPALFFGLGLLLFLMEVLFFHSAGFLGILGMLAMLGALLWSMTDLWPNEPIMVAWSADAFIHPVVTLAWGIIIAFILALFLLRYLPKGWLWDRLILEAVISGSAQTAGGVPMETHKSLDRLIGHTGIATTALRPAGYIEVGGKRYEAVVDTGSVAIGSSVIVTGLRDFSLVVKPA